MFKIKIVEKMKTSILSSINFLPQICAFYEISFKNIVQHYGPHRTIWRMHVACQVTKTAETHSECVLLLCHSNDGCANVPGCYVIRKLAVFVKCRPALVLGKHKFSSFLFTFFSCLCSPNFDAVATRPQLCANPVLPVADGSQM
jgi:hypothetical protein